MTTIPLDRRLLAGSSDLPGGLGRAVRQACAYTTLFGLAPCGVLPATDVTAGAVRSYRTFSPLPLNSPLRGSLEAGPRPIARHHRRPALSEPRRGESKGGMFSVPLSVKLPCPGVTRRTALRSSDFPPTRALSDYGGQAPFRACHAAAPRCEGRRLSG